MRSLMVEIEELKMRNEQLMRVLSGKEVGGSREENRGRSSNERLNVRVLHASESSSSEEQMVNLEVTVREQSSEVNVLVRILEFLERVQNVTLISTNTNLHITEGGTAINVLTFRLRIIKVCIPRNIPPRNIFALSFVLCTGFSYPYMVQMRAIL